MNEQVGEWFEPQELKSVLDIDFNYKNVFNEYIAKMYELTKEIVREDAARKSEGHNLQTKLELKEREIE